MCVHTVSYGHVGRVFPVIAVISAYETCRFEMCIDHPRQEDNRTS